jgi:transposase
MLTMTHTAVTREHIWTAVRRTPDVRLRERDRAILLLMDGKGCPEVGQWLYRDEETIRAWVHALHEAGLPGLERATIPGRPT